MPRLVAFLIALLVFGACKPHESDDLAREGNSGATPVTASQAADDTNTMQPTVQVTRDLPTENIGGVAPAKVTAHLIEYQIHVPDSVAAGKQSFDVQNGGTEKHGLEIEGNGIHVSTKVLSAGDSATLDVDLKPGTYTVYCPVKGHKEKGMTSTLTVK